MRLPSLAGRPGLPLATLLAGLLCLGVAVWAWLRPTHSLDDAYITYRYAHNLATGQGFVYNPGERVLGTTTPLFTLLLAAAWHVWPNLPALGLFFGGVGWAAAVGLLYALGRRACSPAVGLIAAAFLAYDPLINNILGMETHVYVAVILLAFYFQLLGRGQLAALAAGAAFLLRWDGILVVGVVLLAELVRTRRLPWQAAGVALAVIGPWLLFSQLYFGSIFPNTFFAKAGQALTGLQGGGATPFAQEGLNLVRQRTMGHWAGALYLPLLALGLIAVWRHPSTRPATTPSRPLAHLWPLLLWALLYTAGYVGLGVIGFGWYFVPLLPVAGLLIALGAEAVALWLGRWWPATWRARAGAVMLAVLGGLLLWPQVRAMPWGRGQVGAGRVGSYLLASDWLKAHTPPDATVAMLEIGVVGYASERHIIDMMGLVTPSMIGHLEGWDQVNYYGVARHWPDYVLTLNSMALNRPTPGDWFGRLYELAATLETPNGGDAPLRIYQRRAGFPPAAYTHQWPQGLVFDQQFALDQLAATPAPLTPGAGWPVRLEWRVLADVSVDYQFDYELVNLRDGTRWLLAERTRPFYEGGPTVQWRAGQVYTEDRLLSVPAELPPGDYRLLVRAYHDIYESVPVRAGTEASALAASARLATLEAAAPLPPSTAAAVEFAGGLRLDGYRRDGDQLVLYWQAAEPLAGALTAFVHVLDEDLALVAQHDSVPALGQLPMPLWEPGVVVVDPHPLPEAGGDTFCVGLYDPLTLARLAVVTAPDYAVHDDVACRAWPAP